MTAERRADALRNIDAILDAAQRCLAADPSASVTEIARQAGVGRVTLYGHFGTRAELVDALLTRSLAEAEGVLAATDTSGPPPEALARLVGASWRVVHQFQGVLRAAHDELGEDRIRDVHDGVLQHTAAIVDRGREDGSFRTDVPASWQVTTAFSLMHAAAEDVAAGRLTVDDAPRVVGVTLLGAVAAPR